MNAGKIINLIPPQTFRDLAIETHVDNQVKMLSGELVFKLILFSMLNSEKLSLRVMEGFLQSSKFKSFSQFDVLAGKYNSLSDRIASINANYFQRLFEIVFSTFNRELGETHALSKTDSTCVAVAAKLFSGGIQMGGDNKTFVKYSVNLKGSIPSSVKVYTDTVYANDEVPMEEIISNSDCIKGDAVVFDRGLRSRVSFDKFTDNDKMFITRGAIDLRMTNVEQRDVIPKQHGSTVTVTSDQVGLLYGKNNKPTQHKYRVVKGIIDKSGEPVCFITNILDEDAYTIAKWYKHRWKIEIFFKFIKQHLNVKHLMSRSINGIKVMLYMTMIAATLIVAYKKLNYLQGFKIAKLKFELELDNEIIKEIVVLCGGDPNRASHLFNSP